MKAAVIYRKGEMPRYADLPDPAVQNEGELLLTVKAAAIKHFDRSVAKGTHYSSHPNPVHAKVIGGDCIGILANGTRVYALGVSGTVAEKAIIEKDRMVILPHGLDDATAAALPNAVAGAAMALRFRAGIQPGDKVLINGATGFTGRLAVQIARHYSAGKIIATGRNPKSLDKLLTIGADQVISLNDDDENFLAQLKQLHNDTPLNIIIDYLWGHSAELLLSSLKGNGSFTPRTRFVSVGSMTGDSIQLSAENLRSANLLLTGSGLGSWTKDQMDRLFSNILPEMFQLAALGKLNIETTKVNLRDIETLWNTEIPPGHRLVITM